jgi:hypothetical protein
MRSSAASCRRGSRLRGLSVGKVETATSTAKRVKGLKSLSAGEDLRVSVRRPGGAKRGGEGREGWGRVKRGGGGGGGWWGRGGGADKRDPKRIKVIICTAATLHGVYQLWTGSRMVSVATWNEVTCWHTRVRLRQNIFDRFLLLLSALATL